MEESVRYSYSVDIRKIYKFIRKRRKFDSFLQLYAGLLVLFVPCVICYTDLPPLTYDQIYNTTTYVQIQHSSRPYNAPYSYSYIHNDFSNSQGNSFSNSQGNDFLNSQGNSDYDTKGNELVGTGFEDLAEEQLLVGFARDPFRQSVSEEDFLKGVRNEDPPSYLNKGENRGKRGVLHLYNMIHCATGCDPLSYKGYGCYCGFLGSGRPTDGIDNCCKMHDKCYENIYCPFFTVYFQPYYWKCYRGQPLCALENYQTQNQLINGCAARLCDCDRKFAMCVRRYQCPKRRALCRSSPIRLLQNLLMFK